MGIRLKQRLAAIRPRYVVIALTVLGIVALIAFRHQEEKQGIPLEVDPETTPTMLTRDATSMVSDSGYVRYGIQSPIWAVYDQAKEPNWKFPKGLFLEQYDDTMGIVATFECDSAINKTDRKLWEFIGNVRINNILGDKFLSQQLYWDQAQHKLYSDSFIHIEKSDRIIEGYGFVSDELITTYTVNRPTMILPITDLRRGTVASGGDSISPSGRRQMPPRRLDPTVDGEQTAAKPEPVKVVTPAVSPRPPVSNKPTVTSPRPTRSGAAGAASAPAKGQLSPSTPVTPKNGLKTLQPTGGNAAATSTKTSKTTKTTIHRN